MVQKNILQYFLVKCGINSEKNYDNTILQVIEISRGVYSLIWHSRVGGSFTTTQAFEKAFPSWNVYQRFFLSQFDNKGNGTSWSKINF